MNHGRRSFWINFATVILSLVFSFGSVEGFLNLTNGYERLMRNNSFQTFRDAYPEVAVNEGSFLWDDLLFWKMNPGQRGVNRQGFRANSETSVTKPDNTFRIICLGDSVPFGIEVPLEKAYPNLLQERLRSKTHQNIEVINAGVPGYTSWQGLHYLERDLLKYNPDLIVYHSGPNDRNDGSYLSDKERPVPARWLSRAHTLLSRSKTYSLLSSVIFYIRNKWSRQDAFLKPRVSQEDYIVNLEKMTELGKRHGFRTVFIPSVYYFYDTKEVVEIYDLPDNVYIANQVFYVFKKQQKDAGRFFLKNDSCHLSIEGHQLVAGLIADFLIEKNLITENTYK